MNMAEATKYDQMIASRRREEEREKRRKEAERQRKLKEDDDRRWRLATAKVIHHMGLPERVREALESYLRKEYARLGCAVLWSRSKDWQSFCRHHGVNTGSQEAILTEGRQVRYTDNMSRPTKLV